MKNLIRKILKEEQEGFLDSSKEDWEWVNKTPTDFEEKQFKGEYRHEDVHGNELFHGDWVKVIEGEWEGETYQIDRLLGLNDGWDEGHPELSYGHCGTNENGGCITTYDRGGEHFVGHEFELVERGDMNESEGFLDSSEEDWEWVDEVQPGKFQIGGFDYRNGTVIPCDLATIGDTVKYPIGNVTFTIEKLLYRGTVYDEGNIHQLPSKARNCGIWDTRVWSSNQPIPYYEGGYNWYNGNKAIKVNDINESEGFLGSSEEDWDWAEDIEPKRYPNVGDKYRFGTDIIEFLDVVEDEYVEVIYIDENGVGRARQKKNYDAVVGFINSDWSWGGNKGPINESEGFYR